MIKKKQDACPICFSNNISSIHTYTNFELIECNSCKLIFQNNIEDYNLKETISEIYNNDWIKMRDQYCENTFLEHSIFNTSLLDLFCEKKGLVLEIGCGSGEFLYSAQTAGWDVVGIEASENSCIYAKEKYNLYIHNDTWSLNLVEDNMKFDAIVFWHVLEHIEEPIKFLKEVSSVLKDDGLIFFSIPNSNSFTNKIYGFKSPIYTEKDHLYHYSEKNLKILIDNSDLELVKIFSREEMNRLNQDVEAYLKITDQNIKLSIKDKIQLKNNLENKFEGHEIFCICKKED